MFVCDAGVRLDVRVLGAEELLRAVDRELLDLVDDLAAAVVPLARVALGVLVRRHRPDRLEHGRPGEVLGGDQLDLAALALELLAEESRDIGVDLGEPGGRELLERLLCDGHGLAPLSLGWVMVLAGPACRFEGRRGWSQAERGAGHDEARRRRHGGARTRTGRSSRGPAFAWVSSRTRRSGTTPPGTSTSRRRRASTAFG